MSEDFNNLLSGERKDLDRVIIVARPAISLKRKQAYCWDGMHLRQKGDVFRCVMVVQGRKAMKSNGVDDTAAKLMDQDFWMERLAMSTYFGWCWVPTWEP
jgi:hypothetical protein